MPAEQNRLDAEQQETEQNPLIRKKNPMMIKQHSGIGDLPISKELLDILACPACDEKPPVTLSEDLQFLICSKCAKKYPVKNGIPVMLVEEAVDAVHTRRIL